MMGDAYTHIYAYLNTHTCICKHIDIHKHNHQALLNSLMAAGTKEHLKRSVLHLGNMNLWLKVRLICHSSAWRGWEGLPRMDLNSEEQHAGYQPQTDKNVLSSLPHTSNDLSLLREEESALALPVLSDQSRTNM
ncbi:unnamed protein product [Gadus morhua 'NCC']